MLELEKSMLLAQASQRLHDAGFECAVTVNAGEVAAMLRELEKPYITPYLSPGYNDFTWSSSFWFVVRCEGRLVAMGGVRFDDIGDEPIAEYWTRIFARHYGPGKPGEIHSIAKPITEKVKGKLAYMGDLYVAKDWRGKRSYIKDAMVICHLIVSLRWSPDWTYAFLREKDVQRGASALYGFTWVVPNSKLFVDPKLPRSNGECCALISRADLEHWVKSSVGNL